jgi:hypothetical protein
VRSGFVVLRSRREYIAKNLTPFCYLHLSIRIRIPISGHVAFRHDSQARPGYFGGTIFYIRKQLFPLFARQFVIREQLKCVNHKDAHQIRRQRALIGVITSSDPSFASTTSRYHSRAFIPASTRRHISINCSSVTRNETHFDFFGWSVLPSSLQCWSCTKCTPCAQMCTGKRLTLYCSRSSPCAQTVHFVHICMKPNRGDVSNKPGAKHLVTVPKPTSGITNLH